MVACPPVQLALAKTLKMTTVAGGIELEVQRDSLRDQQCEHGQGYLFSGPLDVADATKLLAQRHSIHASVGL